MIRGPAGERTFTVGFSQVKLEELMNTYKLDAKIREEYTLQNVLGKELPLSYTLEQADVKPGNTLLMNPVLPPNGVLIRRAVRRRSRKQSRRATTRQRKARGSRRR